MAADFTTFRPAALLFAVTLTPLLFSCRSSLHFYFDTTDDTAMPEGGADAASQTLSEYVDFVNGLENQDIRKKVENELGRKIIVLKMVLSAENFSARFGSIAGGEFVTNTKK